eukprot:TRINITY_DN1733_c0_g1_i1.p2 TRINITY_DN1733_c0_g1~~TRINITY_DN1733_c0_g1_i1.p2  ORF type:complete len:135 (-),score=39.63 TRINITY_DN1733_c0_g1_i1:69-473(-)
MAKGLRSKRRNKFKALLRSEVFQAPTSAARGELAARQAATAAAPKPKIENSYIKTSTGGLKCSMPSGAEALAADEARMETDAAAGRGRGDAAGSSGARSRSRSRTTKAKAIRILPSKAGKKRKHPLNKHTARGW